MLDGEYYPGGAPLRAHGCVELREIRGARDVRELMEEIEQAGEADREHVRQSFFTA